MRDSCSVHVTNYLIVSRSFMSLKNHFGLEAGGEISSFLSHSQKINILLFCWPDFIDHFMCR
jgi:hypothetical protein